MSWNLAEMVYHSKLKHIQVENASLFTSVSISSNSESIVYCSIGISLGSLVPVIFANTCARKPYHKSKHDYLPGINISTKFPQNSKDRITWELTEEEFCCH